VERARGARKGLVAALVPVLMAVGCAVPGFLPSGEATRARNVILISGDGMGPAHVEAARRDSSAGLELDRLELRGRMVTGPPDDPDETVTDSAAAATAWSTGSRTSNGSVGVDAQGDPLATFGHAAAAAGRATGLVTTTSVTDASPAAFFASVPDRALESRIARQYVDGRGPVGVARRFADANPETLLIVTGDHETGGLSVDDAGLRWSTGDHTDVPPPVLAVGPGSDALAGEWPNTRLHDALIAVIPA